MPIESTRRPRLWSQFVRSRFVRRPLGAAAALMVLMVVCVACSGGSGSASGARRPSTTPASSRPPAGPTPRPAPTGAPRPVVLVPRSIDATGHTDDTKALQDFIAKVPDGATLRFQKNGRYRVEGTLFVRNRHGLTFDGEGALVFATTRGGPHRGQWWVNDGSQIVFRDLQVRGANPKGGVSTGAYVVKLETQHGFTFEGVNGAELDHVRVTDVYGDFVYIGRDKHRKASTNVWVHDSTFLRNGRQGISVTAATNVIIERNHFAGTRRATIDLEPNGRSWHVSNVFVLHNTIGKGRLLFVASHGQGPVDNVLISGNRLPGHALTIDAIPPGHQRRSNWVVTDNVSQVKVKSRPLRFFAIDGLVVHGNKQLVSGKQGVVLQSDCGASVAGNDFGNGVVQRHGSRCNAPLAVPRAPAMLGRAGASPTTTTRPPIPPPPSTTTPVANPGGSHGSTGWIVLAVVLCGLIAIALAVRARRRAQSN